MAQIQQRMSLSSPPGRIMDAGYGALVGPLDSFRGSQLRVSLAPAVGLVFTGLVRL